MVISARLARTELPLQRIIFNSAAPAAAMWLSAHGFFWISGLRPLAEEVPRFEIIGPWLLAFAGLYFLLNTFAVATAIALHERMGVLSIWRAHFQSLWLTFVGGALGAGCVVFALQMGLYGLAVLSLPLLLALILHFAYRHATGRVADELHHLAEVNRLHLSTVEALAHAIDAKDTVTHGHIRRVQDLAGQVAVRLGMSELELRAIEAAALLHDIGKLAIPDHILNKPGRLTAAEFERMKSHAAVGAEILSEVEFPYPLVPIVRHHHENWDGTGYPDGIRGEAIPIGARILAVVDCFDALTSDRPYRRALSPRAAFEIVEARRGAMYDPAIVDVFREICTQAHDLGPSSAGGGERSEPRDTDVASAVKPDAPAMAAAMAVGAAIARSPRSGWDALAAALCTIPGVEAAVIFVVSEQTQRLQPAGLSGAKAHLLSELCIPLGERMSGWAGATAQSVVNADAALDLFDVPAHGFRSGAAVPCRAHRERLVVTLYSSQDAPFSDLHRDVIQSAVPFCLAGGGTSAVIRRMPTGRRHSA
jgi:putative nucleotidyltransferase with HDIG domain